MWPEAQEEPSCPLLTFSRLAKQQGMKQRGAPPARCPRHLPGVADAPWRAARGGWPPSLSGCRQGLPPSAATRTARRDFESQPFGPADASWRAARLRGGGGKRGHARSIRAPGTVTGVP